MAPLITSHLYDATEISRRVFKGRAELDSEMQF